MAIVDASVAVRWFIHGPGNESAAAWADRPELRAPELIVAEVGNALWKHLRRRLLTGEEATAIIRRLPHYFADLTPCAELADTALVLAHENDHPVYDCFYLALAQRDEKQLVTFDKTLARIGRRIGANVELLKTA